MNSALSSLLVFAGSVVFLIILFWILYRIIASSHKGGEKDE